MRSKKRSAGEIARWKRVRTIGRREPKNIPVKAAYSQPNTDGRWRPRNFTKTCFFSPIIWDSFRPNFLKQLE